MKKRVFCLAALVFIVGNPSAWAQQDDIAKLRAALVDQQAAIANLLQRIDELEKKQNMAATKVDLEEGVQKTAAWFRMNLL